MLEIIGAYIPLFCSIYTLYMKCLFLSLRQWSGISFQKLFHDVLNICFMSNVFISWFKSYFSFLLICICLLNQQPPEKPKLAFKLGTNCLMSLILVVLTLIGTLLFLTFKDNWIPYFMTILRDK